MVKMSADEALPTWAQTPVSERGLGLSPAQTGGIMAANGALMVIFQLTVFMWIRSCVSQMTLLRASSWIMIPGFVLIPLVSTLGQLARDDGTHSQGEPGRGNCSASASASASEFNSTSIEDASNRCRAEDAVSTESDPGTPPFDARGFFTFWAPAVLLVFQSAGASLAQFIAMAITINNTVPSSKRGAVNGLAMTIASIGKAIGPAMGGAVLAFSLNQAAESRSDAWRTWPLGAPAVFNLAAIMMVGVAVAVHWLPDSLENPPEETDDDDSRPGVGDDDMGERDGEGEAGLGKHEERDLSSKLKDG